MKASRYNRLFQASDGTWLAFNSWSTALAEIEIDNLPVVKALLADADSVACDTPEKREIRESLIEAHFLIDDEQDELTTLRSDLLRDRFKLDDLYLTIAPTMNCNFRCDYCFEEHLKVGMSEPVRDELINWVDSRAAKTDKLLVTWFGGEPLLPNAYPVVEKLSEAFLGMAEEHNFKYSADLVTNGFFLDRPKMERMAALGVRKVQVTLDGPPEVHDKRRILLGGKGTFWRIIENLKETVDLAAFQIRINVDRRNAMSALDVIELLIDEGLGDKVRPYLAQVVNDGAACGNIVEECYSNPDFAKMEVEIYREAARRQLPVSRYPFRIAGAFCTADRLNGYVIAPNGLIFKCWHEVTLSPEKAIGSLLDGQQPFQKHIEDRWLNWDALGAKSGCQSCDVSPLCHGGCPLEAMKHPEEDHGACEHYKFHLEPLLEIRHMHRMPEATAGTTSARAEPGLGC